MGETTGASGTGPGGSGLESRRLTIPADEVRAYWYLARLAAKTGRDVLELVEGAGALRVVDPAGLLRVQGGEWANVQRLGGILLLWAGQVLRDLPPPPPVSGPPAGSGPGSGSGSGLIVPPPGLLRP